MGQKRHNKSMKSKLNRAVERWNHLLSETLPEKEASVLRVWTVIYAVVLALILFATLIAPRELSFLVSWILLGAFTLFYISSKRKQEENIVAFVILCVLSWTSLIMSVLVLVIY